MSAFGDLLKFVSNQTRKPAEFLVLIGVGAGLITILYGGGKSFQAELFALVGVSLAAIGSAMIMLTYLQQTRRQQARAKFDEHRSQIELHRLRDQVKRLQEQTTNVANFTTEERQKIIGDVTTNLSQETIAKIASTWAEQFEQKSADERRESVFLEIAQSLVERLQEEIAALARRANLNLVIGILVSGLGLVILTWFVIAATSELSSGLHAEDAAIRFVVRLSLAVFIQVFAYFFYDCTATAFLKSNISKTRLLAPSLNFWRWLPLRKPGTQRS